MSKSKGKRYKENKQIQNKNSKFFNLLKTLLIFLIIAIILIIIYCFVTYIQANFVDIDSNIENLNVENTNFENFTNTEAIYENSETVSTEESLVVKGAEYLEIIGVYINSNNPEQSTVSTKIKNTSNEVHENIELLIILMDENNTTITSLDCKIDKIEPNEEILTYSSLAQDLSNCVNYSINLRINY